MPMVFPYDGADNVMVVVGSMLILKPQVADQIVNYHLSDRGGISMTDADPVRSRRTNALA